MQIAAGSERSVEESTKSGSAAQAADILALGRAVMDAIERAIRIAPEVRSARVMARWPLEPEVLLLELEPMQAETSLAALATRLGVSSPQLRSTALRMQRLGLVRVSPEGVALTPAGRQRLARLERARAVVLRRIAPNLDQLPAASARHFIELLGAVLEQAERVGEENLRAAPVPRVSLSPTPRPSSGRRAMDSGDLGPIPR